MSPTSDDDINEETIVAVVVVRLHRPVHIDVTRVDELLVEILWIWSRDVAEVNVQNLFPLHHFRDEIVESVTFRIEHLRNRPLAELDGAVVRRVDVEVPSVVVVRPEQLRNAA